MLAGTAAINGTGNSLDNQLTGNAGANRLLAGNGADTLLGMDGADTLDGGTGADRMEGGGGNDTYVVGNPLDQVIEGASAGIDTVWSSLTSLLGANVEKLLLAGAAAIDGTGNEATNLLTGNDAANRLVGLSGLDTLDGGGGADTLEGGAWRDSLVGGAMADTLVGGTGADAFRSDGLGEAGDTIGDFVVGEDLILISASDFSGGLAAGELPAARFALDAASGALAQFVYSGSTGILAWDADASGGGAAVTIATLTTRPALSAADVLVIG